VLFTPRRYNALPGLAFPGDPDGYPTRNEVITYLDQYAADFELPIKLGSRVRSLRRQGGTFLVELESRDIEADQVVVATGPFQTPRVPDFAAQLAPEVFQTHSAGYRNPGGIPGGTVLVVGGGNTGFQIAQELSATHREAASSVVPPRQTRQSGTNDAEFGFVDRKRQARPTAQEGGTWCRASASFSSTACAAAGRQTDRIERTGLSQNAGGATGV
jgi:cation diffusion facilitator CzcD-associated flavoprotein CzcO